MFSLAFFEQETHEDIAAALRLQRVAVATLLFNAKSVSMEITLSARKHIRSLELLQELRDRSSHEFSTFPQLHADVFGQVDSMQSSILCIPEFTLTGQQD